MGTKMAIFANMKHTVFDDDEQVALGTGAGRILGGRATGEAALLAPTASEAPGQDVWPRTVGRREGGKP